MTRRPDGALESDIMRALWDSDGALSPGDINDLLGASLAYTTVATVLSRLHAKGLVSRSDGGRHYVYEPAIGESELAVKKIGEVLASASDSRQVLAGFVGSLSHKDITLLRAMLDGGRG